MCDKDQHMIGCGCSARRGFLKMASAATALGLAGGGLFTVRFTPTL